jgi:RNA polymerase sigma-70 factor (ECF subfamily)
MTAENINLEELFKKHNTYIYNISIRLTHNKQDAEDLTQDVWIKIVNSINNFRQESNIKTWIYKIIYKQY